MSDVEPEGTTPDPRDLRCSDTDRERVAEALRAALADGRIDLDELSDRLDRTYAARTYRDLEPLVADLPGTTASLPALRAGTAPTPLASTALDRVGGLATSGSAIAIMGGASRKGAWTVPPSFTAVAVMGGVELDLTQAHFESPRVTITAVAFWGGIEIKAPADVTVQVDGVGIMGGFDGPRDTVPQQSGVTVRVTGLALMGGIEVKRPEPGTDPATRPR